MKKITLLIILVFSQFTFAQVGINTTSPDASSMLDISSTDKGILVPRVSLSNVTLTTLDGTNTAATGLLIWNTNASTTGGNGVGFYFFNGTQWMPISQTAGSDDDWHISGTSSSPTAITDNIVTQGNVTIGNSISGGSAKLNVLSNTANSTSLRIDNSGVIGLENQGIQITNNSLTGTSSERYIGVLTNLSSSNGFSQTGFKADFDNMSSNGFYYGLNNDFQAGGTNGYQRGLRNYFGGGQIGFGVENLFPGAFTYSDVTYGVFNSLQSQGNGSKYGTFNSISGTGTGTKYGTYTSIGSASGGTHYGIYSDVLKTGSYAGYFLGQLSVGTTTSNNYILPASRGTNGQVMQTNGTGAVSWVTPTPSTDDQNLTTPTLTGTTLNLGIENGAGTSINLASLQSNDHDWYEVGTTNPPNNINDDKYSLGNITIGTILPATSKLDVISDRSSTIRLQNNTVATGNKLGIVNTIFTSNANTESTGIQNAIYGDGIVKTGVSNLFNTNSSILLVEYGVTNNFFSSNNIRRFGFYNECDPTSVNSNFFRGFVNNVGTNQTGLTLGFDNDFELNSSSDIFGLRNNIFGTSSGNIYGSYNSIYPSGNATIHGSRTIITNAGTGFKYGNYITISNSSGGTHYGIYSDVLQPTGYAGYFRGRVAIGNGVSNEYILPLSRGTNNQIMQTDGAGNVSWVNPPTITDDQNLLTPTLTGTTLNLGIENGTGTSVNLSGLQDADWYEVGGATPANAITDNIYTGGDVSIGKNTAAFAKVDIDANNKVNTLILENDNSVTGAKNGINNTLNLTSSSAFSNGIRNVITGNSDWKFGIRNFINSTSASLINELGMENVFSATGNSNIWGYSNFYSPATTHNGNYIGFSNNIGANHIGSVNGVLNTISSNTALAIIGVNNALNGSGNAEVIGINSTIGNSGTGDKYGEKVTIGNTLGGTHYGLYSDVTKINSFAGYFLGNVSIGTTATNNYILPSSRGTNGQIMQTNAAGLVNWVNSPISESTTANNGLTETGNNIQLGGTLNQNTTVTQGAYDMTFNVNNSGTFKVQDNGVDKFEMNTFGDGVFGGATYWRDGTTATTSPVVARLLPNTNSGYFQIYNLGTPNHTISGNSNTIFNGQGLDQDFIIESNVRPYMFYVDAGEDIVRIGNNTGGLAQDGTLKNVSGINFNVDYLANFTDGGIGSTIGVGTAEFITDGGNQILMMDANLLPFNDNDDGIGSSAYRWTNIWATNGTINTSDLTLKKNIKPLHYGLETLMQVETLSYQWKDNLFNDKKIGFSAQNLKKIIPEVVIDYDVVVTNEETNIKAKIPSEKLGVYYSDIIPITVKAIQELKVKNDTLEERVKFLEVKLSKLEAIEAKLKKLEKK